MNKQRRKELEAAKLKLDEVHEQVTAARDDEQEYFDVMPEGIQQSDKGDAANDTITALDEALSAIEEAQNLLDDAVA